jgi:hypothetical protein
MFALKHPAYDKIKAAITQLDPESLPPIVPQNPEAAEKAFLDRYYELTEGK